MAVRFEAAGSTPTGHLARPAEITGQPYTRLAWFRFDDDDAPGDCTLWSLNSADESEYDSPETIGGHALRLYTSSGNTDSATNQWQDATWHCFALVRNGNVRTLYRLDAGVVQILVRSTSESLTIAEENLLGYATEVYSRGRAAEHEKCWNAALTVEELAREAQQFAPVRTTNLQGWSKLTTHTDLSDEIGGAWTAAGVTPTTVDGPDLVEEWEGPKVASSNTTAATSSSGGLSINLPGGIESGDLLLAFAANDTNVGWSASASWTQIDNGANGSAVQGACWARLATGSDALTITGEANDIAVVTARIPAAQHGVTNVATDIVLGTAATGNNAAPNGPACNPGTSGKWLWLTYYAADDDDDAALWWPAEGAPVAQVKSATDTSSCQVGVAYRWLEASSYDPGAFALSAAEEWRAQTFAIPAAGAAPIGIDPAGVPSSAAYGSATVDHVGAQEIAASGIASQVTIGSATVAQIDIEISTGSIGSPAAFGSATITGISTQDVAPASFASSAAVGAVSILLATAQPINAPGLASTAAIGSSAVANVTARTLGATGVASVGAIGPAALANVTARTITAAGLASAAAIGSQTVAHVTAQAIAPSGLATSVRFGATTVEGGGSQMPVMRWLKRISIGLGIGL